MEPVTTMGVLGLGRKEARERGAGAAVWKSGRKTSSLRTVMECFSAMARTRLRSSSDRMRPVGLFGLLIVLVVGNPGREKHLT
jgi:hypothetical protein